MNEELDFIKKEGWILSESGLKTIDLKGTTKKNITKVLLDRDLRELGAGIADLFKGKFEKVEHELVVLQILKLRNISAPKSNESSKTAPRMLKLQLTDGQHTYSAIELEPTALSLETKPGTKISLKVKQLKSANGQLLLTPKNMEILGGHVESLVSKWEISRSLATTMKGSRSGAAPPFIPFGQKIQQNLPADRGFKSLQQNSKKEAEENSEFNAQRQDAIAEATKAATRKTFGGGNKILVDSNVQKIMDKGFTEEQATVALKFAKNNVEKALANLKRREERQQRANSHDYETRESHPRESYASKREGRGKGGNSEAPTAKPSTGVSLFDFLENKIPETTSNSHTNKSYAQNSSSSYHNERFENNISSSFRKHDKENSNKSHQHWSQQQQQYSSNDQHQSKSSQNYHQKSSYNSRNSHTDGGQKEHYNRDYSNKKYEREPRDYHHQSRDGGGYRESKYQSSNNYSSKPNSSSTSNAQQQYSSKSSSTYTSQSQKPPVNSSSSSSNANSKYDKFEQQHNYNNHSSNGNRGSKYGQKPDYSGSNSNSRDGKMTSKDYNNYSSSGANNNSNYNSKYEKPTRSNPPPQQRNIVESIEKMSLNKSNQQSYKSYESSAYESKSSSSYPPLTAPSTSSEPKQNYSKANYPIVGFQNKEANEQAKNALKTKNIPGNVQSTQQQQQWQAPQQPPAVPIPVPIHSIQSQPPSFVQHPSVSIMPQPAVITATNPQVFHAAPISYPGQIIMQSVQPTPPIQQVGPQPLKVGDLCLAKYWEDGKFYNAKITGISDSTFVVLFTEYGNAEEVRKNDCVPLISVPTCPTPPQPMPNFVQSHQMSFSNQHKMPAQQHGYHNQQGMPYKGKNPRRN